MIKNKYSALKKIIRTLRLDAMTPEFKAANAELLKAIKMNDKSGAVPHADLEAVNKAMKANDAEKVGAALKKVQLQFSKAEKKLDDDVKSIQAKLETAKKADNDTKAHLKAKKSLNAVFEKLKTLTSGLSTNPKSASKLIALTDKKKEYSDLSKRAAQIITLVSSGKDALKQIDMLKKAVDASEKKYKKDMSNVERDAKKTNDALEVAKMQVKITQGKRDAFQKERLFLANVVKQIPSGRITINEEQSINDPSMKKSLLLRHGKTREYAKAKSKASELLVYAATDEYEKITKGYTIHIGSVPEKDKEHLKKLEKLIMIARTQSLSTIWKEIQKEMNDPYMKKLIHTAFDYLKKYFKENDI